MQPVMASEIGRHIFCARALFLDHTFGGGRNKPLSIRVLWFLLNPLRMGLVVLFAGLYVITEPLVAAATVVLAGMLLLMARALWERLHTPPSIIVYHGTKAQRHKTVLVAKDFGLSGQPHYLLTYEGGSIPILARSAAAPEEPHAAHVMQVIAYCLLVAESTGSRPPYGVIRYGDGRTFEVDFDEDSVEHLSGVVEEIEANRRHLDVPISHNDRGRCFACSHRKRCVQSLFP
jgi:CRISPR-associated exonuclease Cas4